MASYSAPVAIVEHADVRLHGVVDALSRVTDWLFAGGWLMARAFVAAIARLKGTSKNAGFS